MLADAYLGLGSNLGDRRGNISAALDSIQQFGTVTAVSSLYETRPKGFEAQPAFLNAACRFWTRLDSFELLARLQEVQRSQGKGSAFVNGPRKIDVDILLFGRTVVDLPGLTIPHPRMAEREFVLAPLLEIAPELRHPVLKVSVRELLKGVEDTGALLARG